VSNQHQRKRACLSEELVRSVVSFFTAISLYGSFRTVIKQCGTKCTFERRKERLCPKAIILVHLSGQDKAWSAPSFVYGDLLRSKLSLSQTNCRNRAPLSRILFLFVTRDKPSSQSVQRPTRISTQFV
jgi:hypothetical protein